MFESFFNLLKEKEVEFFKDEPLSKYSYLGIGGRAKAVVFLDGEKNTVNILSFLLHHGIKFKVLGNLSNTLVSDNGYDGVVLITRKFCGYNVAEKCISVSAGTTLLPFVKEISKMGLGGFESLSGIPGSIGGMVYGNAGAYGASISDLFLYADVYFFECDNVQRVYKSDMRFSYRTSILKSRPGMILSVAFKKIEVPQCEIESKIKFYQEQRKKSQPYGERSLGSVFKRNSDIPISRLVDELGLKGLSVGGARISEKHAGFIVCEKNSKAEDFLSLIAIIKEKVFCTYGIVPEEEIEFLS